MAMVADGQAVTDQAAERRELRALLSAMRRICSLAWTRALRGFSFKLSSAT